MKTQSGAWQEAREADLSLIYAAEKSLAQSFSVGDSPCPHPSFD